jgi:hypothetical protein
LRESRARSRAIRARDVGSRATIRSMRTSRTSASVRRVRPRVQRGRAAAGSPVRRLQVAGLPPISVLVVELAPTGCGARPAVRRLRPRCQPGSGPRRSGRGCGRRSDVDCTLSPAARRASWRASCSARDCRPAAWMRSASTPQTRSPARMSGCATGSAARVRCMSMKPAGGPRGIRARCGR